MMWVESIGGICSNGTGISRIGCSELETSDVRNEIVARLNGLQLADSNEAETRLKVIDRVLFEVLGWTHDDVTVECRVSEDGKTKFIDYLLKTVSTSIVIEAKKVGAYEMNVPNLRTQRLNASFVSGELAAPIRQARNYARSKAVPFAVVTNGESWIVFPASRIDGVSFANSKSIIFPSLSLALTDDHVEFTHLLSRQSVVDGSLEEALLSERSDQNEERRLRLFFTSRSGLKPRNELYPLIQDAVELSLTNSLIEHRPDFLKKCYVQTAERRRFDKSIQMHLKRQRPLFDRQPARPLQRKDVNVVSNTIKKAVPIRPFALLVLGQVGCGKTTFIQYTRLVTCKNIFQPTKAGPYAHWIYIDFRGFSKHSDVEGFIYNQLNEYVVNDIFLSNYEQCLRPAYGNDIRSLRDGPLRILKSEEEKDQRISQYLFERQGTRADTDKRLKYAATKKSVFLVIDNIDQLQSTDLQSEIFSEAIAISHRNNFNLIIALREATFVEHKNSPVFDAFDFTPVTIEPPQIPAVLSRRFVIMREILRGISGEFVAENGAKIVVKDLADIVDLISSSVLGTNIGRTIDVMATSDVRLALRMTREFLAAGYTNPGRAVQIHQSGKRYVLPPHEALRSLMLGSNAVYQEVQSVLGNPFDSYLSRNKLQLLRLFILSALVRFASEADFQYVDGPEIRKATRGVGYGDKEVLKALEDLCKLRFLHTASHNEADFESSFYPSILGGTIIRHLMADFTFLETVMMDTFISDKLIWDRLYELSESIGAQRNVTERLRIRIERIRVFMNYIRGLYEIVLEEANRRGLPREWRSNPFEEREKLLERNVRNALVSAERNYGGG